MLPGPQKAIYPTLRLAIGRRGEGRPEKLEHFIITRQDDEQPNRYVIDKALQTLLCEAVGQDRPKWVPAVFTQPTVERAVRTELALYQGGRAVCRCGQFVLKPPELYKEQGLPDPDFDEYGDTSIGYYHGIARREYWREVDGALRCVRQENLACDPHVCPFAQPANNSREYMEAYARFLGGTPTASQLRNGTRLCKPKVTAVVIAPWIKDDWPFVKVSSSAWGTARALPTALQLINERAGVLAGLPIRLTLNWRQSRTPKGIQKVQYIAALPPVSWDELPRVARELVQPRLATAEAARQADALLQGELKALPPNQAFQQEFHPDAPVEVPSAEARLQELADKAGWTPGQLEARLAACKGDAEAIGELEKELEGAVFDGAVDAEPLVGAPGEPTARPLIGTAEGEKLRRRFLALIEAGKVAREDAAAQVKAVFEECNVSATTDNWALLSPEAAGKLQHIIDVAEGREPPQETLL